MAAIHGQAIIKSGKKNKQKDLDMDMDMDMDDRVDVMHRRFYLVKLHEFRNPNLVEAEKLLDLRFAVSQTREVKLVQRNRLQSTLQNPSYYHVENWNRMRDGLRLLRRCMSIANIDNNVSKEEKRRAFRTLHGSSSLAKERKVEKQMNEAHSSATKSLANTNTCCEDYGQIMERLEYNLRQTKHDLCKQKEGILVKIQQLRHAMEASENADHRGKLPASSDCREDVEKKIKDAIELLEGSRERLVQNNKEFAISVKELREVEEELASLGKQLSEIDEVMSGYYRSLAQRRKQYQEENACHDKNVLLLYRAGKLADEKDLAALGTLSEGQVEEFMGRWNEDEEFRNEYKRRARASLNSRGLRADGRTRNPDEEPIALDIPNIKLPNRIRKLLIKKRPTVPT